MAQEPKPRRCEIRSDGTPEGTSILVDGVELGDVCTELDIRFRSGEPTRAYLALDIAVTVLEIHEEAGHHRLFKVCANCAQELNAPVTAELVKDT